MAMKWKCPDCPGTGRVFRPWYAETSQECLRCDATGDAMVNGEESRHRKRLFEERFGKLVEGFQ